MSEGDEGEDGELSKGKDWKERQTDYLGQEGWRVAEREEWAEEA